jgi:hypothetical protein
LSYPILGILLGGDVSRLSHAHSSVAWRYGKRRPGQELR